MQSNGIVSLVEQECSDNITTISGVEYVSADSDLTGLIGCSVKYFYKNEANTKQLLWAWENPKNKVLNVRSEDLLTNSPYFTTENVVYSENNPTSIKLSEIKGENFEFELTPAEDYKITGVTVKMGDTTLTQGTHYTYENGCITIASVTGNLTITVTTHKLKSIGEKVEVEYTIENQSQYDAELGALTCTSEDTNWSTYISLTEQNSLQGTTLVKTATSSSDKIEIEMIRSYAGTETADEQEFTFNCSLPVTAKEVQ